MDNIIAFVTAVIAIIVAIISGLFSYFSSKNTAKVESMKGYIAFLQIKMSKLEEAIKNLETDSTYKKGTDNIAEGVASNLSHRLHYSGEILTNFEYLFTHEKSEYIRLSENQKKIGLALAAYSSGYKLKDEYKNNLIPLEDLPVTISEHSKAVKALIVKEQNATFKKFEDLSLMK